MLGIRVTSILFQRKSISKLYFICLHIVKTCNKFVIGRPSLNACQLRYCTEINDAKMMVSSNNLVLPYNLKVKNGKSTSGLDLGKSLGFLYKHNVSTELVEEYFDLICDRECYWKLLLLQDLAQHLADVLPLLRLPRSTLELAAKQSRLDKKLISNFPDRISYLCHHFKLSVKELMNMLIRHTPLLTMNFQKLDARMQVLKNANIDVEFLVKDPWIFNYSEKQLLERTTVAVINKIQLKPWLLRCSKSYFQKYVDRWTEEQKVLKGDDITTFLAKKLNCASKDVHQLMQRNKQLRTINVIKLNKIINLLMELGYPVEEIRNNPRIFCYSVITLENSFRKFRKEYGSSPNLAQLGHIV